MTIDFSIEYFTHNDEQLVLVVEKRSGASRIPMVYNNGLWRCRTNISTPTITYHYELCQGDTLLRREWGTPHKIDLSASVASISIRDHWHTKPHDISLRSTMFTDGIFARRSGAERLVPSKGKLLIRAEIPAVSPDHKVVLVGEGEALGNWSVERGVEMNDAEFPLWSVAIDKCSLCGGITFKCVIVEQSTGEVVAWQQGENMEFDTTSNGEDCQIIDSLRPQFDLAQWRGAGVAIPLFSLRSESSFGVGEFNDLRLMVDWAVATGQKIIQLLPINDTTMSNTWRDSYPYNANSTFALHPQFIHLPDVGTLDSEAMARFEALGKELNALDEVDYERVNRAKVDYLHLVYQQVGDQLLHTTEFSEFLSKNLAWLLPYAVYCALRDKYGTSDFNRWGKMARYSHRKVASYAAEHSEEVGFYYFVQYHLDLQLGRVRDYAHSQGVALKGDIPIGISRTSVDAWASPELFNLDSSAGAPPDDFSVLGQNWGFPTYNWAKMAEDNYAWWRRRFAKMAEYFDAYRIDHILGFFRIWEIPLEAKNALLGHFNPALPLSKREIKEFGFRFVPRRHTAPIAQSDDVLFVEDPTQRGYYHPRIAAQKCECYRRLTPPQREAYDRLYEDFFYHRHDDFWREVALRRLPPLLESTKMLACGEDLGMIPSCVAPVMAEEQILSLEVQRMPKEAFAEFADTARYPYLAVATTSTHDMNPIRAWWGENHEISQRFYNHILSREGVAPEECMADICKQIIGQHLASPAMLTILPWQDWLSTSEALRRKEPCEERINIPANAEHRWCYRMHLTLEALLQHEGFNREIYSMIKRSGR